MKTPNSLGQFEQVVLTAVLTLGDNAYGVTIHAKVEELSRPRRVVMGAVYSTLDRLEDKGFIASRLTDPTPERGGRAKRCYRIESAGKRAMQETAVTARRICDVLEQHWGDAAWSPGSKKSKPARQS